MSQRTTQDGNDPSNSNADSYQNSNNQVCPFNLGFNRLRLLTWLVNWLMNWCMILLKRGLARLSLKATLEAG